MQANSLPLLIFPASFLAYIGVRSDCVSPVNAEMYVTDEGQVLWICSDFEKTWNDGYRVLASGCEDETMIEDGMVCGEYKKGSGVWSASSCVFFANYGI